MESPESLQPLCRLRLPTEARKGYKHILAQIAKLVEVLSAETGLRPKSIGIGHPGTMDPQTGTLKNSNTQCLNGRPFDRDLEALLGIPVRLANDANCFAVAEALLGAAPAAHPNPSVVFGVILGTGVGGGLVVNGRVLKGRQGIAGEWGHNYLDETGGECYCGKYGCVEKIISGPALETFFKDLTGVHLQLKEIARLAEKGEDAAAVRTMDRMVEFFGKAIAVVINIVDPDVIVLGGGVGNIDILYTRGVAEARKHLFNNRIDTIFSKPKLGDSAGVFGAALLTE